MFTTYDNIYQNFICDKCHIYRISWSKPQPRRAVSELENRNSDHNNCVGLSSFDLLFLKINHNWKIMPFQTVDLISGGSWHRLR